MLQALSMEAIRELSRTETAVEPNAMPLRASIDRRRTSTQDWNPHSNPDTMGLLNRDPENVPNKDLLLQAYKDTLIITIKGIAAGMQNTGWFSCCEAIC